MPSGRRREGTKLNSSFPSCCGCTPTLTQEMTTTPQQDSRYGILTALGVVTLWFTSSSVLTLYSDALVSMTIGDRNPALFEQIAIWISIILQPWGILALALESIGGMHLVPTSLAGSIIAAILSWTLLYFLLARFVRRYHRSRWLVLGVLTTLSIACTYSFVSDMQALPPPDSHSGP
jgi:hypothetical protein